MFGIDYYDALLLSGEYQVRDTRYLEELRGLPEKEKVKIGIPYMDEMVKRLASGGESIPHERTVLLAPSWGKSAILMKYGEQIINLLLETGYHIIIRPHPQSFASEKELMDKLMEAGGLSAQVVEPVMKTAGIAIVTRLAADFCRDAKEGGLASAVELAGTALALVTVLPLMSAVIEVLTGLI